MSHVYLILVSYSEAPVSLECMHVLSGKFCVFENIYDEQITTGGSG